MLGEQLKIDGELFASGTVSQILAKSSLRTKAMVRSGETNQLAMKKVGSQMLGHTWDPTLDEISFKLHVDVSTKKERAHGKHKLITMENIHKLKDMKLMR